jgi:RHS repeat-associated protein
MSRLATIGGACDSYAAYEYLTTGRIVEEACAAPGARLSCDPECDNSFSALDRFGRVVDQKWHDHGASEVRDQYRYGYDRAGNRLFRENTTTTGKDEFYGYDAINRLIAFDRGDLNAGKTAISGTPVREEDWALDSTGNWPGYVQKTSGTTDLDQSRTHNKVNEITAIAATTGTDWADPVHERAGNMTTIPKPASPADALSCEYDAWNRLVVVMDGQTLVGQYRYDGLNRRIRRYAVVPDTHVHYFYNSGWQILETRQSGTPSAPPETVQPKHQYAWSLRYIDAPILRDVNTDGDGLCDDERLYYLGDANFNVTTLVNGDGDAVERYVYEPYGQVTFYDGAWTNTRNTPSVANDVLYTGREYDAETGLYHYRNRYYDPELGTFVSRDPIGEPDGPSSYAAHFVPNHTDPMGTWTYVDEVHWRADSDDDTFEKLIGLINHYWGMDLTEGNRSCIVPAPEKGGNERKMERMWQRKRPAACGVYNVANLLDVADGGELRAAIGDDINGYIAAASSFYGAPRMAGLAFEMRFASQSQKGRTPLSSVIIVGHSSRAADEIGGDRRGGPATHEVVKIEGRNIAFAWRPWRRAIEWDLPMGCWLRTDAIARFVGCKTEAMARHAASQVMRGSSSAHGTTTYTFAVSSMAMGWGKLSRRTIVFDPSKPTAQTEQQYHSHDWWVHLEGQN